jgi:hypothetical protein
MTCFGNGFPLPDDILKFIIQPMVYSKNLLLEYFTGDPDTGYPILRDTWDSPHLNIIRQLLDAVEMNKVNPECFPHPLVIPNKEKMAFAKESVKKFDYTGQLYRKITHKIFNKFKPKSLDKIIQSVEHFYTNKIRYNRYLLLKEIRDSVPKKPYNFSNDVCLNCNDNLPLYTPSIRKNWKRCIADGYNPRMLLKRICSRKCDKINLNPFCCANCMKICRPGTDFYLGVNPGFSFYIVHVNPDTRETTLPAYTYSPFLSNFGCSNECYFKLLDFSNVMNNKYLLLRNTTLLNGSGILFDQEVIDELQTNMCTIKSSVVIFNPLAEEFHPI